VSDDLAGPRRFRRRLTLVFVAFVGIASGFLAVTSFFVFREYRSHISASQADRRVELAMTLVPDRPGRAEARHALAEFRSRGGFDAVIVSGTGVYSSLPGVDATDVPGALRAHPSRDNRHAFTSVHGVAYRVVGRLADDGTTQLYAFFPRADVLASITQFRNVLAMTWLATLVFAAVAGHVVARRTLRPIRDAARASRRMAGRLLDDDPRANTDDEFGLWAASFNDVAGALERKIAELSEAARRERRFTANVAHELRTPLSGMSAVATIIEDTLADLPADAQEPVRILVRDVHRLRQLVVELLELARLDAGADAVHLEPLSVEQAVGSVVRPWSERASVILAVDVPTELVVLADRARFKRVLGNLVDNAVEHGGGHVTVRAVRDGDTVAISVTDHGDGLDPGDLDRVFDRFYKRDRSRSGRGAGLGLAIALEHARAQGGSLHAGNADEGGARFTFVLRAGETDATSPVTSSLLDRHPTVTAR
jgi:two-component system sensor histidine kinase MtrB